MKNIFLKQMSICALLLGTGSPVYSYVFTFKNYTGEAISAGVVLAGVFEPMYEVTIPAQEDGLNAPERQIRFVAGEQDFDKARKFGLCLEHVFIKKNNDTNASALFYRVRPDIFKQILYRVGKQEPFTLEKDFDLAGKSRGTFVCENYLFAIIKDAYGKLHVIYHAVR